MRTGELGPGVVSLQRTSLCVVEREGRRKGVSERERENRMEWGVGGRAMGERDFGGE